MENNTWRIVQLPAETKAIKAEWVLDYKPGYKDVEPRYKARLLLVATRSYSVSTIWTHMHQWLSTTVSD
jgi:hypothetical protein